MTTLTDTSHGLAPSEGPQPGLTLVYSRGLARAGEQVRLAGRATALFGRDAELFPGGPFGDPRVSGRHAALAFDRGDWLLVDRASKNGTFVNGQRISERKLAVGDTIRLGSTFIIFSRLPPLQARSPRSELAGVSEVATRIRESIALVAPTEQTVLLLGESGTGKEVVAREIHRISGRGGPFLAVNCASLRGELLESELFGHTRGAFTGAQRPHDGLFRRADQGTLLLDEIAEMDPAVQVRLLRVLEARAVRPVGATDEVPVDTRVVAATNQDAEAAVKAGRLRADLYARLARWIIRLQPLRERREDLGVLTRALLQREGAGADVTAEFMEALLKAHWPLNVRGLLNVLTTARISQPTAARLDLDPRVREALDAQANLVAAEQAPQRSNLPPDMARVIDSLRAHAGNIAAVARDLNLSRPSLYRLLEKLDLDPADYRD